MDDMAKRLMSMLNDQESLEKIKGLSAMLEKEMENKNQEEHSGYESGAQSGLKDQNKEEDVGNVDLGMSEEMMNMMLKIMPLMGSLNTDDENTRFLAALRPLLSQGRKEKLDKSMGFLKIFKLLPLLKNIDLF